MKNKILPLILPLFLAMSLCGCGKTDANIPAEPTEPVSVNLETPSIHIENVKIDLSGMLNKNISLVDILSSQSPSENVMISGLSLDYALAMLANGASPSAAAALEQFLGQNTAAANDTFGKFLNRTGTDSQNKLVISNSFWVKENLLYGIKKDFSAVLENIYKAEISKIPMNESGISQINKWAEQATDGMIKKALSPSDITEDTVSILVNAILLDGKWAVPFKANYTFDVDFTRTDNSTFTVSGMHSDEFFYYENEYATAFRKDYQNQEFYMVGILPKKTGEFNLSDLDIAGLLESGKSTDELNAGLHIMLPKVDFEMKYDLTDILKSMGLSQIFDENANNFSGIYENTNPDFASYASTIIQNDRLIIDETGTKAAAVTSVIIENTAAAVPEEKRQLYVYLNRPFVVLLMDGETDEPLFIAKIVNP